jgi:hypothetical protein
VGDRRNYSVTDPAGRARDDLPRSKQGILSSSTIVVSILTSIEWRSQYSEERSRKRIFLILYKIGKAIIRYYQYNISIRLHDYNIKNIVIIIGHARSFPNQNLTSRFQFLGSLR